MCRYPVQDHADSLLMHIVHKVFKIIGSSVSRGRRIITGHLISPGLVQRVLHHRHQFHMGKSHFLYVLRQHRSDFPVIIKYAVILRFFPGAQMHFVDIHRGLVPLYFSPLFHPVAVLPAVFAEIRYHTCRIRAQLGGIGVRIRLQIYQSSFGLNLIFVQRAFAYFRNEQFINTGFMQMHLMHSSVPVVEIAHNADTDRIWCPHGKTGAAHTVDHCRMRAQHFIDIVADSCFKLFLRLFI